MKTLFHLLLLLPILLFAGDYTWRSVPIGGGGYVTGIFAHPAEADLIYIRTDVGGVFRWDPVGKGWIAVMDEIPIDEDNLYGVTGLALAPSDPDIVYIACDKARWADDNWDVLKSTDRGATWQRTGLEKRFYNHSPDKSMGECIAVDPENADIVFCGTSRDGLWKTMDGGQSWSKVAAVPSGDAPTGIKNVVFQGSNRLYVGVHGTGIYLSDDGGETFTLMPDSPKKPTAIKASPNSTLFVGTETGIFRYQDGIWTQARASQAFYGISIDAQNPDHIVALQMRSNGHRGAIIRSTDGGESWRAPQISHESTVPWWPHDFFSNAGADILIDPHYPNRVWFCDWFGIWRTDDISETQSQWRNWQWGHEESYVLDAASTPIGARYFATVADVDGFRWDNLKQFPQKQLGYNKNWINNSAGIDFCEADPNKMVRLGNQGWDEKGFVLTSDDNGVTWHETASSPGAYGKVAVSATNPDNFVVCCIGDNSVFFTQDGGAGFTQSSGVGGQIIDNQFRSRRPVASDRVNGDVFYIYKHAGQLYRSDDGGATFQRTSGYLSSSGHWDKWECRTPHGLEGHVWVSLDRAGLYRSDDFGESFTKLPDVDRSVSVAFGKHAPDADKPAVFVYGEIYNEEGIFRSDDYGQTWVRINDDQHMFGCDPRHMSADRQVYGTVYIGTGGRGAIVGEIDDGTGISIRENKTRTVNDLHLLQNYPNPFNPETRIVFTLKKKESVTLDVVDILGKTVAVLLDDVVMGTGTHTTLFDGSGLASGVYFARLKSSDQVLIRKMMLNR